jgi:hypothetical protein
VNQTKDFLLHLDDENCQRFHKVHDVVKSSEHFSNISGFFMEKFGNKVLEGILKEHIEGGVLKQK